MLLLLLMVWLAHTPVGIAAGRLAITLAIIAAIAFSCGTQTASVIADDRYDRNKGPATHEQVGNENDNTPQLREGTLIPPTVGRIVMLGRRWAFIPINQDRQRDDDLVTFGNDRTVSSMVGFKRTPRPTRLGAGRTSMSKSSDSIRGATLALTETSKGNTFKTVLPQVLVVENLMLQRIAEAIRADGSDDRWTVSGEVTEYFNENQLLIRTAQRASSN